MRLLPLLMGLLLLASLAAAEIYTWVDEAGVTHIVDDPAQVPEAARGGAGEGRQALSGLWRQDLLGPAVPPAGAAGPSVRTRDSERVRRLIRGAIEDLERGETSRAIAVLEGVLRREPGLAEPHWYLALLDRQRGRYGSAEAHLRAFLASAGEDLERWRPSARRRLAALEDERRLADAGQLQGSDAWVGVPHPHFRVFYDSELGKASPDYADTVLRYLEDAHASVGERLGATPAEPMGVMLYGKAAYLRAHRHRFSFQTVGFFDGRIHVVSAAHPAGELRALLFHEYTHAVFREQTGGDRPYWLNEGLAELSERASRGQRPLTRSERSSLRRRIDQGSWIPIGRISDSFSGLEDGDARAAYLIAAAAAHWIEGRTDRAERGRLLRLMGEGASQDEALIEVLGLGSEQVDAAVRRWIRAEFPPPAASLLPSLPRRDGETPPAADR